MWVKRPFLPLALCLLWLAACAGENRLAASSWQLLRYGPPADSQQALPGVPFTAVFTSDAVSGQTGCSGYSFQYQLGRGEEITIDGLLQSEGTNGCIGPLFKQQTEAVLTLMATVQTVTVSDAQLVLTAPTGTLTFVPRSEQVQFAPSLENFYDLPWKLVALEQPDGFLPANRETAVTLIITPERISGFGGCSSYEADLLLVAQPTFMQVGELERQFEDCPPAVGEQEQLYFSLLSHVQAYEAQADSLTLYTESGSLSFQKDE